MKFKLLAVAAWLLLIVPSQASPLVDQGSNTYDPNTGLQWLDVNLTVGRSYTDVLANLSSPSDVAYGYRYATGDEIVQLFIDAGLSRLPNGGFCNPCENPSDASAILNLITLLGPTRSYSTGEQYVTGFNADIYQGYQQYLSNLHYYNSSFAYASVPQDISYPSLSYPDVGSFLVEVSPTPLVPAANLIRLANSSESGEASVQ